jgi:hypothetical protein
LTSFVKYAPIISKNVGEAHTLCCIIEHYSTSYFAIYIKKKHENSVIALLADEYAGRGDALEDFCRILPDTDIFTHVYTLFYALRQ